MLSRLQPARWRTPGVPCRPGGTPYTRASGCPGLISRLPATLRTARAQSVFGILDSSYFSQLRPEFLRGAEQIVFGSLFSTAHDFANHPQSKALIVPQFKYKTFFFGKAF